MPFKITKLQLLFTFSFLLAFVTGCRTTTTHGVRRPVPLSTAPDRRTVERALDKMQVDSMQEISTSGMTQFAFRRGSASAVVLIDSRTNQQDRLVLSSVGYKVPQPDILEESRILMDEAYRALRQEIPNLPPPDMLQEQQINLPKEPKN